MRTYAVLTATVATAAVLSAAGPTASGAPASGLASGKSSAADPHWVLKPTGSTQQFRGLDALDASTAWVGGSDGQVLKTSDGGATWEDVSPPDSEGLLFRDVEIISATHVSVMAIGEGEASRIYTTLDGGESWTLAFVNDDEAAFYDCMDFWAGGNRGIGMSDPVDGKFRIIRTWDGGLSWHVVSPDGMPEAVAGEFGFAASGTCLVAAGGKQAWLASGGGASRIFHSRDAGFTWTVTDAPIPASDAGGVFSLDFRNPRKGIAVGGDFLLPDNGVDASGYTRDGGDTWTGGGDLAGYRSGVSWVQGRRATAIAVGPTGSDITYDFGVSWSAFDETNLDAVVCVKRGDCWASGPAGTVAVLDW
jgi:photosystem II stability/assembly factor-like uncharacterized protein